METMPGTSHGSIGFQHNQQPQQQQQLQQSQVQAGNSNRQQRSMSHKCSWMPCAIMCPLMLLIFLIIGGLSVTTVCISIDRGPLCTRNLSRPARASKARVKYVWTQWAQCSNSIRCSAGDKIRFSEAKGKSETASPVTTMQMQPCKSSDACPQLGSWSYWMEWSSCTQTCGEFGLFVRQRQCLNSKKEVIDAEHCDGLFHEAQSCGNRTSCSTASASTGSTSDTKDTSSTTMNSTVGNGSIANGTTSAKNMSTGSHGTVSTVSWSQWSAWSPCSATCQITGMRSRTRQCIDARTGARSTELSCAGGSDQVQFCAGPSSVACSTPAPALTMLRAIRDLTKSQSVAWLQWSAWSACSATCSPPEGVQKRSRQCGGLQTEVSFADTAKCGGHSYEERSCLSSRNCASSCNCRWAAGLQLGTELKLANALEESEEWSNC
uniref:TSP1_spondin domain-containing protein n=1 Tax=Macrostomum lignano TaxID=282301 RepID=A0A1I8GPJ5_9PLAT